MAITKPPVLPAWADAGDKVQPSNAELSVGWPVSSTPPSRQRFNWVLNYVANAVRYFSRRGLVDYDAAETYMTGDRVIGDDGKTYKCLADNTTGFAPSTNPAKWGRWGFTLAELNAEATTPAQFDNSTKLATTAFVQRAQGNSQGVIGMGANLTLTQPQVGSMVEATGTGGYTLTLCSTTGVGGGAFSIYNNCSSAITVAAAGGQNINVGTANVSSFSIPSGGTAWLITDGVSWEVIAGTVMGVGGNQTWQSLGGSRVAGTTYYNTTGRPIMVCVGMTTSAANTGIYATVSPGYTLWGSNSANSPYVAAISFIVPPGGSYSVQMQSGTTTILTWLELR